jgi:superfamily II DNA helicase RecQ
MGIDKKSKNKKNIKKIDVRFVIHYDLPKSLEGFYQESGFFFFNI